MAYEALCPQASRVYLGKETLLGGPQADRVEGAQVSLTLKGLHLSEGAGRLLLLAGGWGSGGSGSLAALPDSLQGIWPGSEDEKE